MPHGKIYPDVTETVGNTPLIRLNRLAAGLPGKVAVKHEGYNPFDSVKDRIGAAMINDAVEQGRLRPGMLIVEPTSGNTGIGLAYVAAARGYRCIFTMPDINSDKSVHFRHKLRFRPQQHLILSKVGSIISLKTNHLRLHRLA